MFTLRGHMRHFATLALLLAIPLLGQSKAKGRPSPPAVKQAREYSSLLEIQNAAAKGDAGAQYLLGLANSNGLAGLSKNDAEAVKWFQKAADQGDDGSQAELGRHYQYGLGVEKDLAEAMKWYRKAAEQGSVLAQRNLGYALMMGEGVEKDPVEGLKWYRKAAGQGDSMAQRNLGMALQQGNKGVPQNFVEAARWLRAAANQGVDDAQFRLGMAHLEGQGVTKNVAEAYIWFSLAAGSGNMSGVKGRDLAASMLSPQALRQAQAKAMRVAEEIQKRKKD